MLTLSAQAPAQEWWEQVQAVLDGSQPRPLRPVEGGRGPEALPGPLREDLLEGAAVVLGTSGSTGRPKQVVLDAAALTSSARATLDRLGGPGQWLQTLSPTTIAGWQVWVRSVLAGIPPVVLPRDQPFGAGLFVEAARRLDQGGRRCTALVPTQLHRLLTDPDGIAALAGFDAVLVGGAALPTPVREQAAEHDIALVTTYGMTETSGGALYDGVPLAGVTATTDDRGRMMISGPVLARGYLGDPERTAASFVTDDGRRWFRTADLAEQTGGRWQVLARADDVINTGGHKVLPATVEQALLDLPGIRQVTVVGVPDPEWGQRVAALVIPSPDAPAGLTQDPTGWVRARLRDDVPAPALPRQILLVTALPLLPGGKVDRVAAGGRLSAGNGTL